VGVIMNRFVIDNYLYNLSKDIKENEIINSYRFNNKFDVKISDLRKELEFFKEINIELQCVLLKYRGKTCLSNPKNIKIIIGRECNGLDVSHLCRSNVYYGCDSKFFSTIHHYIFINTLINYPPKSTYMHEITHTQLVKEKNLMDGDNEELLPIFMEYIYGHYNNLNLILHKLKRLSYYIEAYMITTSEKNREDVKKYIISTLKAIELYELYVNNHNMDKEISNDITNVFKYKKSLEEVLDKYNIDYDNYKPSLKRLLKLGN